MNRSDLPSCQLVLTVLGVTLLLVFPCSYQTVMINQPYALFQQFFNESYHHHSGGYFNPLQLNAVWGGLLASTGLAGIFSSLFIHTVAERFGVRKALLIPCNILIICAAICEGLSKLAGSFELFFLGQILGSGMAWSVVNALGAVYLTECSPPNLRGATGTIMSVGTFLGMLVSYILGMQDVMGTEALWPYYVSLTVILSTTLLLLTPFFPDSPKEIYMRTGDREKTIRQIERLYGRQCDAVATLKEYDDENHQTVEGFRVSHMFTVPHLRSPLIVASMASIFAVTCGPMVTLSLSTSIFGPILPAGNSTEWETRRAELVTVAMATPLPLLVVAASVAVERFGRRPLIIGVGVAMTACLFAFSLLAYISVLKSSEAAGYAAFVCLLINTWISPFGPFTVCLFLSSELLPQHARPVASAICIAVVDFFYMAIGFGLPPLQTKLEEFGAGPWAVALIMGIPSVFCLWYLYVKLPETKGLPVNEIVNLWVIKEQEEEVKYEHNHMNH